MQHYRVTFLPDNKSISIHKGATLLEAAGQSDIILNTVCGGEGICRKCMVVIEPEGKEVLACQYAVSSDLTVTIPEASRFFEHKILDKGIELRNRIQPDIYKRYLDIASDKKMFGIAVDIGTTTVVAKLIDMASGKLLATQAQLNPQTRFGDDVISRITFAESDDKLAKLQEIIIGCINNLIEKICIQASIKPDDIYEVSAVGNTTMTHIFSGMPITQLGQAPYEAHSLDAIDVPAAKTSLKINPAGNIHTAENIAGFMGSDIVAGACALDMCSAQEMTLMVDIGTNGEIVLGTAEKLYAASCAAGPALEGARISCGSLAADGAIEAVVINSDDIDIDVIGNTQAHSICGSGLIDTVAVLLDLGIINDTGRFKEAKEIKNELPSAILSRVTTKDKQPAFVLAEENPKVILTQRDIRQFQLAKAAIRSGIILLQKKMGIEDGDIKKILLAGAFGNYIRKQSALRVGLLPNVEPERIHFVGNAASSGATMLLLSRQERDHAQKLARKIEYVEIAHEKNFTDVFTDSMIF